jgi:hypothetical protein
MVPNVLLFSLLFNPPSLVQQDFKPQKLKLSTFGVEVSKLGSALGYRCLVPGTIEGSPIVSVLSLPIQSLKDLNAFCGQLDVTVEIDEDKKELKFVGPKGIANQKINEAIYKGLRSYTAAYGPYRNASYMECYKAYKEYLQMWGRSSGAERYGLELKMQTMLLASYTPGRALLNSLLDIPAGFDRVILCRSHLGRLNQWQSSSGESQVRCPT